MRAMIRDSMIGPFRHPAFVNIDDSAFSVQVMKGKLVSFKINKTDVEALARLIGMSYPSEVQAPEPKPEYIGDRPLSDYTTPRKVYGGTTYDTVLGYMARTNPEATATLYDPCADTKRDGFWLSHRCKREGVRVLAGMAPKVLREQGIYVVNYYPLDMLQRRCG